MQAVETLRQGGHEPRKFKLESFVPYRLSLLSNTVSESIAASYRDQFGVSITEWRVIAVLGRFPGLSARDVVERTAMDKVAISRAVKRLEERGLVTRSADDTDRRCMQLHLTPGPGQAVFEDIVPRAMHYENVLLETLSAREMVQLDRLLSKLQAAAAQLRPGGTEGESGSGLR